MQKILFADDDPGIREVLSLLLTAEGYEAIAATDGEAVLEKMDESIDLVILDVMMPLMSGYTVCSRIRQRYTMPILFLTAKSQESDKTLGFSVGGDDYLVKPFSYNELISRVKAMLRRYTVYGSRQLPQNGSKALASMLIESVNQLHHRFLHLKQREIRCFPMVW